MQFGREVKWMMMMIDRVDGRWQGGLYIYICIYVSKER